VKRRQLALIDEFVDHSPRDMKMRGGLGDGKTRSEKLVSIAGAPNE
jgi:hypothetical protein